MLGSPPAGAGGGGGGGMSRNSSRFLVDMVEQQDGDAAADRSVSPAPVSKPSCVQSGRFEVECPEQAAAPRSVQFVVGDGQSTGARDSTSGYDTHNVKSFRNVQTLERVPCMDHYRNILSIEGAIATRPTLAQLREDLPDVDHLDRMAAHDGRWSSDVSQLEAFGPPEAASPARAKFGWVRGVFVRCVLNILGVMLYLRISWVAGQAGVVLGSAVVLLSTVVTVITAISMCAISTNGDMKGGGCYFMISRSLGPDFGGSIGLIFAFANAVGAAMYIVGFAETVRELMREHGASLFDSAANDIRLVAFAACVVLFVVCLMGVSFESKMQLVLIVVLAVSLVSYLVGTLLPPTAEQRRRGVTGYSRTTLAANLWPAWRGESFFSVLAVFFPAATGIMAGANISGDLADAQTAIPRGTLLAIAVTTVIYVGGVWLTGATCVRDALCAPDGSCEYGLLNYFQVMEVQSAWGPLITAGIFAATLSSALVSLVSAPKVFQAVCKDDLFPYIGVFAKGYGKADEPRRAYVLAFSICLLMILIGDLNAIAPIISNFFLAAYALINYCCFDGSFSESPGFRPGFKYYNMWLSLLGAVLCVGVMFVISWWTALLTVACLATLYIYVHYKRPHVNWGSSTQAHSYKAALAAMQRLTSTEEHVKNYRPQVLVLTGNPVARPSLVDFAANVTKDSALLVCGHVIPAAPTERAAAGMAKLQRQMDSWLRKRRVNAFYASVAQPSFRVGVQTLLQLSGLGKLRPNILLLGFKNDWRAGSVDQIADYCGVINDGFDAQMGVGVLRLPHGLDFSELMREHNVGDTHNLRLPEPIAAPPSGDASRAASVAEPFVPIVSGKPQAAISANDRNDSTCSFAAKFATIADEESSDVDDEEVELEPMAPLTNTTSSASSGARAVAAPSSPRRLLSLPSRQMSAAQKELLASINEFQRRQRRGVIDVWWLFDDGGLALLVPHLLRQPKSYLEGARLRVFTIASSRGAIDQERRAMASLLAKFRIDYADVFVIPDIARPPAAHTVSEFEQLVEPFRVRGGGDGDGLIGDAELAANKARTQRQLRTRELLLQHSRDASLVVLTLPVPRRGVHSSCLYMAWLDMLTTGMPPMLLLRGNQQSVLTFYS